MADISKLKVDNAEYDLKDSSAREELKSQKEDIASKQDKLIAGKNITIEEDGKTISASGGGDVTYFTVVDGLLCCNWKEA